MTTEPGMGSDAAAGAPAFRLAEFELSDLDTDQRLLAWSGASLLVFTGAGCAACRWARANLPLWRLPVDRLCWIDAENSGGLVERYGVFHLPALFVVRDGRLCAAVQATLRRDELIVALMASLAGPVEELP